MAWNGSKNIVNLRCWRGALQLSIIVASPDRLHASYDRLDTFTGKHRDLFYNYKPRYHPQKSSAQSNLARGRIAVLSPLWVANGYV